jgi:PAS domain S-box-containing protein
MAVALAPIFTVEASAAEPKRVLVVHSFGSVAPPFTTHSIAFETELVEKMGERVDLDEVSLDMARYADPNLQEALVEYLQKRQAHWQPDLVVPIGSPAGVFVEQYRDRLFPETPILYTGMDRRRLAPNALDKNAAFVGENFDLTGFVDDVLQVAPATKNIAVVIGASPVEQYWAAALRKEFEPFANRINFIWLNDLSLDQMLEKVRTLPPDSFIFLFLLLRDATGVTHNADEALRRIHAVANAPINSIYQHQLGLGIVGGRLYQAELEGIESARIAVRILHGEPTSHFPPTFVGTLSPRYDWRELQRWKIDEKLLPPGSTILYRTPTVWQQYRGRIIAAISVCVLEALLIAGLVVNRIRRRRAERSLTESEQQMRLFMEATADCVWNWDLITGHAVRNAGFQRAFGYSAQEVDSSITWWEERLQPDDRRRVLSTLQETMASGESTCSYEYRFRCKDGTDAVIHDRAYIVRDARGKPVRALGAMTDITEPKEAQQQIEHFADLFQALSRRLLNIQEEERHHLARELHDEIGQTLTAAKINLEIITPDVPAGAIDRLDDSVQLLDRLLKQVRELSLNLRPPLLDELGLVPTLRWLVDRQAQRAQLRATCTADVNGLEIDPATQTTCFRVAQEAITNIIRHAGAKSVSVELWHEAERLWLSVRDDGAGFDPVMMQQRAPEHSTLGLVSMKERALLVGGGLEIHSTSGQGTEIRAWFPLTCGERPSTTETA